MAAWVLLLEPLQHLEAACSGHEHPSSSCSATSVGGSRKCSALSRRSWPNVTAALTRHTNSAPPAATTRTLVDADASTAGLIVTHGRNAAAVRVASCALEIGHPSSSTKMNPAAVRAEVSRGSSSRAMITRASARVVVGPMSMKPTQPESAVETRRTDIAPVFKP